MSFCTICGKKLKFYTRYIGENIFSRSDGTGYAPVNEIYRCPEFVEGVSDRYYHYHDEEIIMVRKVPVDTPGRRGFLRAF